MNPNFTKRELCDACNSSDIGVLLSISYEDPRLLAPLLERYHGNIQKQDLQGARYELAECRSCKHVFQTYVPSDALSLKIYSYSESRVPESVRKRTHAPLSYYMGNALAVERMGVLLGHKVPYECSVLDVGAGWGYFLLMAKAFGYQITGVEVSKERKSFLTDLGIPVVSSLDELQGRIFDYVHVDQVLEHVSDPFSFLRSIVARVKEGGLLYVSVPNGRLIAPDIRKGEIDFFRKSAHPLEHINCFSHHSLVTLAKRVGLHPLGRLDTAKRLLRAASIRTNAHLAQSALLEFYRYGRSTDLYFTKP